MPLELAGEEAFPPGNLLIPGLQDLLPLRRGHGEAVGVGLVDVGLHASQVGRVLHLAAHDAHQEVVDGVVVHEVAAPPRPVGGGALFAVVAGFERDLGLVCRESRERRFARRRSERPRRAAAGEKVTFDRRRVARKGPRVGIQQSTVNEKAKSKDRFEWRSSAHSGKISMTHLIR